MTSELPVLPSTEFLIPLSEITVPADRARDMDPAWAEALGLIIAAQGLTNAITVRVVPSGGYSLVTGLHRLGAHRLLAWPTIRARLSTAASDDEAKLEEVMENLGRNDLKALDRCHHLYELKQVHERLYPETKNGGDRKSQQIRTKSLRSDPSNREIFGFTEAIAQKIGLSRRAIEIAVKIWTDLSPASRARIAGTWLADNQSGLKLLSERKPAIQEQVLDALFIEPPRAATVPDALALIDNGVALTPVEKKSAALQKSLGTLPEVVRQGMIAARSPIDAQLAELRQGIATLSKFIGGLKDDELDNVIVEHEDRIIASLKRRGRI